METLGTIDRPSEPFSDAKKSKQSLFCAKNCLFDEIYSLFQLAGNLLVTLWNYARITASSRDNYQILWNFPVPSLWTGNRPWETRFVGLRPPPGSRREPPSVPGAHNPLTI
jgi:hypothetical protein